MPSLLLRDVEGSGGSGGGVFVPTAPKQYLQIAAGQTGTLISAPAVDGVVYKITTLFGAHPTSSQSGISLGVDLSTIVDQSILTGYTAGGINIIGNSNFAISETFSSTQLQYFKVWRAICCNEFIVTKNAGNTTQPIIIAYEIGVKK